MKKLLECIHQKQIEIFEKSFRKLTINDRAKIQAMCAEDGGILGHINFTIMFICQDVYNDYFREYLGCLIKKPWVFQDTLCLQYPIGTPEKRRVAVKKLVAMYSRAFKKVRLFGASKEHAAEAEALFGRNVITVEKNRNGANYMMDLEEQVALEGSYFQNRRRKLSKFNKTFNWTYEELTKDNLEECLVVNQRWFEGHYHTEGIEAEQKGIATAVQYFDELNLIGDVIRVDGKVVAFTMGAPFNDEIYLEIVLKILDGYPNASLFVQQEEFKSKRRQYKFENIFDDAGITGMREHKEQMYPAFLEPYYDITIQI